MRCIVCICQGFRLAFYQLTNPCAHRRSSLQASRHCRYSPVPASTIPAATLDCDTIRDVVYNRANPQMGLTIPLRSRHSTLKSQPCRPSPPSSCSSSPPPAFWEQAALKTIASAPSPILLVLQQCNRSALPSRLRLLLSRAASQHLRPLLAREMSSVV